jgi:polyhydroxyalkanoate synthesis regulator phasin
MKTMFFGRNCMQDLVKKALYLGVGIASYAAEQANTNLKELTVKAQKLADTLVERGEMNAEEARRYVDELIREAQGETVVPGSDESRSPRRIEIVSDDSETTDQPSSVVVNDGKDSKGEDVDSLRRQVEALQAELQRLNRS